METIDDGIKEYLIWRQNRMEIYFSKDQEQKRVLKVQKDRAVRKTWEFITTTNIVEALRVARDLGWKDKKVQVRMNKEDEVVEYVVEPYEAGCGCTGLLKYDQYF